MSDPVREEYNDLIKADNSKDERGGGGGGGGELTEDIVGRGGGGELYRGYRGKGGGEEENFTEDIGGKGRRRITLQRI